MLHELIINECIYFFVITEGHIRDIGILPATNILVFDYIQSCKTFSDIYDCLQ